LYWYISKKELDFKFDSISNLLTDSLTSLQFYRLTAPLVSEVKCGHTVLTYSGLKYNKTQRDSFKKAGTPPLYQLNYFVESNRIFVHSVNNKDLEKSLNATEILAIDNIPAGEIISKIKNLFGSDGYNQTYKTLRVYKNFTYFYYLQFGLKDYVTLQLKKINQPDSIYNYVLKKLLPTQSISEVKKKSKEEIKKDNLVKKIAKKEHKKNKYKGYDWDGSPILKLTYDSVLKSTATMKIKSFMTESANYNRFFKESFKELKYKNIQNLILDLRDNSGGKLRACNTLFRYLYNKPHQFTGRADMVNR
jgi:hypothetical protein